MTLSAGTGLNYHSPYTYTNTTTPNWTVNPSTGSGKLRLEGTDADVEINGVSLLESIKKIEQRLNILTPNPKLEAEWDQLRELGEQYRALEKKLKEQGEMWDRLKSMPPPDID